MRPAERRAELLATLGARGLAVVPLGLQEAGMAAQAFCGTLTFAVGSQLFADASGATSLLHNGNQCAGHEAAAVFR